MGKGNVRAKPADCELAGGADAVTAGGNAAVDAGASAGGELMALAEWLDSPPPLLHKVDLDVLQERVGFIGRARSSLTALEAQLVAEIARREGDAAAEEMLRRDQKRSRSGARKAVKTAAQLEWAPRVADRLASGAITPEAAGLILDAAGETPVDHGVLLAAAEDEPDDLFRRTLKDHVNERTSEQELERRREGQRRRRRASIGEQPDGMFHLFAQFDPLTGARVQAALVAKADALFRSEDSRDRPTSPQRFADALAELVVNSDGDGVAAGTELIVLADYDQVHDTISNAQLADGTRLTEAEALAVACDTKILPGIFNKHTGNRLLGRSQRKVPPRLRKRLVARDGGCIGCGASEKICEVHHDHHWAHGGETTLDNTCLVCWRCHHIRIHLHGEVITRHPNGRRTLGPPTNAAGTGAGELGGLRGDSGDGIPVRSAARCKDPATDQVPNRAGPLGSEQQSPGRNHTPTSGRRRGPPKHPEPRQTGHVSQPSLVGHESSLSPAR